MRLCLVRVFGLILLKFDFLFLRVIGIVVFLCFLMWLVGYIIGVMVGRGCFYKFIWSILVLFFVVVKLGFFIILLVFK